jgi:hypothetical protein
LGLERSSAEPEKERLGGVEERAKGLEGRRKPLARMEERADFED